MVKSCRTGLLTACSRATADSSIAALRWRSVGPTVDCWPAPAGTDEATATTNARTPASCLVDTLTSRDSLSREYKTANPGNGCKEGLPGFEGSSVRAVR